MRRGTEKAGGTPKTEAATRPRALDYCKSGHMTVAKQVSRHLGGELASFSWDPPGCRVVQSSMEKTMGARTPSSHHVPVPRVLLALGGRLLCHLPGLSLWYCSSICPLCVPQTSFLP